MSVWSDNRAFPLDEEDAEPRPRDQDPEEQLSVDKAIAADIFRYRLEFFRDRVERKAAVSDRQAVFGQGMSGRAKRRFTSDRRSWALAGAALLGFAGAWALLPGGDPAVDPSATLGQSQQAPALGRYEGDLSRRFISHDQLFLDARPESAQ
jgi:hypothetical protein